MMKSESSNLPFASWRRQKARTVKHQGKAFAITLALIAFCVTVMWLMAIRGQIGY
jgi:hypothetical protein